MRGRFDAGLRAMRRSFRILIPPDVGAERRKQYALAERIASASFDYGFSAQQWEIAFNRALREIQQFDKEFEEVRA